jgi:hypothetical protein
MLLKGLKHPSDAFSSMSQQTFLGTSGKFSQSSMFAFMKIENRRTQMKHLKPGRGLFSGHALSFSHIQAGATVPL